MTDVPIPERDVPLPEGSHASLRRLPELAAEVGSRRKHRTGTAS